MDALPLMSGGPVENKQENKNIFKFISCAIQSICFFKTEEW